MIAKGRYAFFLESSKLEYEAQRDCRLTQVGNTLDNKGYGIATQKGSPLRDLLSTTILKLQTEGVLQNLKNKWWVEKMAQERVLECDSINKDNGAGRGKGRKTNQLSMNVLGGAFIVPLGGIFFGIIACIFECLYFSLSIASVRSF